MAFNVPRRLVDVRGSTLRVSRVAQRPWMLTRNVWPVAHPDRSVLQEGTKGPVPEGACDSQPLAQESLDQVVAMPHHVRMYSGTSLIHGQPCHHPLCKASTLAAASGALPATIHSHSE